MQKVEINADTDEMVQPEDNDNSVNVSPGSYEELSPNEFNHHRGIVVILLKAPQAESEFSGFKSLISVPEIRDIQPLLENIPHHQPIGLVCPDGSCSGRLATRLSNQGFRVYHLGGGLQEWYYSLRGITEESA